MPKITVQQGGAQKGKKALPQWEDISGTDPWIKMALYGRSGTGKTTLWSTFPKPIGAMIASGAGETKSIRNIPQIQAVRLEDEEQLRDLTAQQASDMKFKTFVLDHGSGYQELVLKKVLGIKEVPQQLSWGFADREDWGKVASRMKENLIQMLRLDCHVVIVAQERNFNDEGNDTGVLAPYVNCAFSPSVTGWLCPQVDYLVETFLMEEKVKEKVKIQGHEVEQERKTGEVKFCLRTAPHPVYETKFRLPKGTPLPKYVVDPSYEKIAKLISGVPVGAKTPK